MSEKYNILDSRPAALPCLQRSWDLFLDHGYWTSSKALKGMFGGRIWGSGSIIWCLGSRVRDLRFEIPGLEDLWDCNLHFRPSNRDSKNLARDLGFGVWNSGSRIQGRGLRVWNSGFGSRIQDLGSDTWNSLSVIWGKDFWNPGSGFWDSRNVVFYLGSRI